MTKRGAPLGNRNAAGPRRRAREERTITTLIVALRMRRLRFSEIGRRLSEDFGIVMTTMAIRQRYRHRRGNKMLEITLYTKDGRIVTTVTVPPFTPPPEIILWGARYFIRRDDGNYYEGMCWPILEGGF